MTEHDPARAIPQVGRRVAPRSLPFADTVLLADVSASMAYRDGPAGGLYSAVFGDGVGGDLPRRIDRLAEVLGYLLRTVKLRSLVCFSDLPVEITLTGAVKLPEPTGSTDLAEGLRFVGRLVPVPARVIVISDGEPNDEVTALTAARGLRPMAVDAYYVGPDDAAGLKAFMARLAASGGPGGRSGRFDLSDPLQVAGEIRALLTQGR